MLGSGCLVTAALYCSHPAIKIQLSSNAGDASNACNPLGSAGAPFLLVAVLMAVAAACALSSIRAKLRGDGPLQQPLLTDGLDPEADC